MMQKQSQTEGQPTLVNNLAFVIQMAATMIQVNSDSEHEVNQNMRIINNAMALMKNQIEGMEIFVN